MHFSALNYEKKCRKNTLFGKNAEKIHFLKRILLKSAFYFEKGKFKSGYGPL